MAVPQPQSKVSASPSPGITAPKSAAPPATSLPAWLWALAGAVGTALAFGAYRLVQRRRMAAQEDQGYSEPEAVPPLTALQAAPKLPGASVPPTPRPTSPPPAPPRAVEGPFEVLLQPQRLEVGAEELVIELELLIGNRQPEPAENIRVQLAMMSASPDQDRSCAAFHSGTLLGESGISPFDLGPGSGGRMPVRLAIRRDALHVVQVAGRPMFVPLVLIDLRWRAGISIRRFGADFMIGTTGQGSKLGPIWLDRPVRAPLSATRYLPRDAAVA